MANTKKWWSWVPRRPKRWLLAAAVVALIFVIAMWKLLSAPAVGTVVSVSASVPSPLPAAAAQTYRDHYLTFRYPANYDQARSPGTGTYLDSVTLVGHGSSAKLLSVTVRPAEDINADPSVRQRNTALYARQALRLGGDTGISFTKQANAFEQTVYVEHGPYTLTVSLSDPNGNDLSSEFQQITQSLVWL